MARLASFIPSKMMRMPLVIASLILAGSCAEARQQDEPDHYPFEAVLNSFKEGCSVVSSSEDFVASVVALGWATVKEPERSAIWPVIERANQIARDGFNKEDVDLDPGELAIGTIEVFERHLLGEDIFLVYSEGTIGDVRLLNCHLYDPGETREFTEEHMDQLSRIIGTNAVDRIRGRGLTGATWVDSSSQNNRGFTISYLASGSEFSEMLNFSGLSIAMNLE